MARRTRQYEIYHQRVVEACVSLMGENSRNFYDLECTYFEEFEEGVKPLQVAGSRAEASQEPMDSG